MAKTTLVLTLGALTGCAAKPGPEPQPTPPVSAPVQVASEPEPAAVAQVDANLARLRGLSVIEVGMLVIDAPEGAFNCYGPCPAFVGAIAAAKAKSAVRLERLVEVAAAAVPDSAPTSCEPASIDRNVAALQALRIVDVQGLIKEQPKTSVQCYGQPCAADLAAAQAKTCERAGKLAGIAAAAKDL